jgi:hypothetical protein
MLYQVKDLPLNWLTGLDWHDGFRATYTPLTQGALPPRNGHGIKIYLFLCLADRDHFELVNHQIRRCSFDGDQLEMVTIRQKQETLTYI